MPTPSRDAAYPQEIRDAYERELDRWERETGEHRDSCPMDLDEFAAVLDSEGK